MSRRVADEAADTRTKRVRFAAALTASNINDPDLDEEASDDDDEEEEEDQPVAMRRKPRFGEDDNGNDADEEAQRTARSSSSREHKDEDEEEYDEEALHALNAEGGPEIEPFNLSAEREMGHFGADGNFVWTRRDLDNEDDPWLEQVGKDVRATRAARTTVDDEGQVMPRHEAARLIRVICELLVPGESSLEALRRLGAEDKDKFNRLTEAVDTLLSQGLMSIYSEKREALLGRLPPVKWVYRVNGGTFGPFVGSHMEAWRDEGFFAGENGENVLVKQVVGDEEADRDDGFVPAGSVTNFLYAWEA